MRCWIVGHCFAGSRGGSFNYIHKDLRPQYHHPRFDPQDVRATSDGGYIPLAATESVNGLVKTDPDGNPQWHKELGCFSTPPDDYMIGAVIQQTTDGGYILGGGAIQLRGAVLHAVRHHREAGLQRRSDLGQDLFDRDLRHGLYQHQADR